MSRRMLWWSAPALLVAGCASGAWHVSDEVLALAKETRAGGAFMIEVDATGYVVNADTQVEMSRVPKAVLAAAEKELPGPAIDAEIEVALGVRYWEIEKKVDGRTIEIVVTDDGRVVGKEEELAPGQWPKHIVDAANAALPNARITTVELVQGPEALGGVEYHVKKDVGGELVRLSVFEDGRLGRVVRKIKAEFRVPR